MIHGDGVEVYLKPSRMGAETLRFPELELKSNDGFRKQCYVPVIEEYFQLVVKFSDTFNMFSAECLHIGVDFGQGQYINQKLMPLSVRRSPVTGQQLVHCGFDDVASKQHDLHLLKMKAHEEGPVRGASRISRLDYDYSAGPGTILVVLRRGSGTWADQDPGDLSKHRRLKRGSFKHFESKNGHNYVFEFFLQSKQDIIETQKRMRWWESHQDALDSDTGRFSFIADPEFQVAVAKTKRVREEMSAAWAKRSTTENVVAGDLSERGNRRLPQTCDCPTETHVRSRPVPVSMDDDHKNNSATPKKPHQKVTRKADAPMGHRESTGGATRNGDVEQKNDISADDALAKTCKLCRKPKKPPRGKKLTWRQRTGRWMYVRRDAADEEVPSEEQDDEEVSPSVLSQQSHLDKSVAEDEISSLEDGMTESTTFTSPNEEVHAAKLITEDVSDVAPKVRPTEATTNTVDSSMQHIISTIAPKAKEQKERQSELILEMPVQNRNRIDIDLTADPDGDTVFVVKSERISKIENTPSLKPDSSMNDLQQRLKEVRRLKRILELEQEETELERRVARQQKQQHVHKRIKKEYVIKIEG